MSHDPTSPLTGPAKRSLSKILLNTVIVSFFAVSVVVASGSFGLFGCYCFEGARMREDPQKWGPIDPVKGDMPPVPSPAK